MKKFLLLIPFSGIQILYAQENTTISVDSTWIKKGTIAIWQFHYYKR